ncbi:hypothetical protein ACYULU_08510 [Breznakiellaceae bacterium SP9]
MNFYRPLRDGLFIYECVRLIVLVRLLVNFVPTAAQIFPYLAYAAPQVLFVLMALFLVLDLDTYQVYSNLYAAGKIVSTVTFLAWFITSIPLIVEAAVMQSEQILFLPTAALLLPGDFLSIIAIFVLMRKIKRYRTVLCLGGSE